MLQLQNKKTGKGPLWLVEKKYVMGSDGGCDIRVAGEDVSANHAEFHVNGDSVELVNLVGGAALTVNGRAISGAATLNPGDVVQLGGDEFVLLDPKASKGDPVNLTSANSGWALKALNTALADKHFPLEGLQTIGRSQECDVSLGVVHLSRKHAKVTVTDRGLQVQDLNSSNGTYINGKKVNQAIAIAGDEISFDTLRFRVIGPIIDEDKTALRPSTDGDLTTIRPALKIPAQEVPAKPAAAKAKARPKAAAAQVNKVAATSTASVTSASAGDSRSKGLLWAALAVIVGAALAWFFLT